MVGKIVKQRVFYTFSFHSELLSNETTIILKVCAYYIPMCVYVLDINECLLGRLQCTEPHTVCNNTIGSAVCICADDYALDTDDNACKPNGKMYKYKCMSCSKRTSV